MKNIKLFIIGFYNFLVLKHYFFVVFIIKYLYEC